MEEAPHCNWLKCRKPLGLEGRAVVTTCSHVFCVECANHLFTAAKTCPACDTVLDQPDDVSYQSLNPSQDYRTSILAGLAPATIMEIATRALAFWSYQSSQEAAFQQMILRNAQERNTILEKRAQTLLMDAKTEISLLQEKLSNAQIELTSESRKNQELQDALRTRTKDYEHLKRQFDRNQRKALLPSSGLQDQIPETPHFARSAEHQNLYGKAANGAWGDNHAPRTNSASSSRPKGAFWAAQAQAQGNFGSGRSLSSSGGAPGDSHQYPSAAVGAIHERFRVTSSSGLQQQDKRDAGLDAEIGNAHVGQTPPRLHEAAGTTTPLTTPRNHSRTGAQFPVSRQHSMPVQRSQRQETNPGQSTPRPNHVAGTFRFAAAKR